MATEIMAEREARALVEEYNEQQAALRRARTEAAKDRCRERILAIHEELRAGGREVTRERDQLVLVLTPEERLPRERRQRPYDVLSYEHKVESLRRDFVARLRGEMRDLAQLLERAEAGDWRGVYASTLRSSNRDSMIEDLERAELLERAIRDLAGDVLIEREIAAAERAGRTMPATSPTAAAEASRDE